MTVRVRPPLVLASRLSKSCSLSVTVSSPCRPVVSGVSLEAVVPS